MRLNRTFVFISVLAVALSAVCAQELPPISPSATPAPSSVPPAPPAKREPTGYLRVWDFATVLKGPVEISVNGGTSQVILAYSTKPGQFGSYRQLPAGRYRLSVRAANPAALVPGTAAPPANRSPELIPAVNVEVADGSFQTLLLRDEQGGAKPIFINDAIAPSAGKRLRVFNFAAGEGPALKILNPEEVLWPQIPPGISEHLFPKGTKAINLALITKLPNGHESRQITEADFSSASGVSIAISAEADGGISLRSFVDAKD